MDFRVREKHMACISLSTPHLTTWVALLILGVSISSFIHREMFALVLIF